MTSLKRELGVSIDGLLTGEENQDLQAPKPGGKVMALIEKMLVEMDEEALRKVLKYTEDQKQLADLLAGKKKSRKAQGE